MGREALRGQRSRRLGEVRGDHCRFTATLATWLGGLGGVAGGWPCFGPVRLSGEGSLQKSDWGECGRCAAFLSLYWLVLLLLARGVESVRVEEGALLCRRTRACSCSKPAA